MAASKSRRASCGASDTRYAHPRLRVQDGRRRLERQGQRVIFDGGREFIAAGSGQPAKPQQIGRRPMARTQEQVASVDGLLVPLELQERRDAAAVNLGILGVDAKDAAQASSAGPNCLSMRSTRPFSARSLACSGLPAVADLDRPVEIGQREGARRRRGFATLAVPACPGAVKWGEIGFERDCAVERFRVPDPTRSADDGPGPVSRRR